MMGVIEWYTMLCLDRYVIFQDTGLKQGYIVLEIEYYSGSNGE